jgi:hypothetical protein
MQQKNKEKEKAKIKREKKKRGVDPVIKINALLCSYFLSQSLVWVQLHMEF